MAVRTLTHTLQGYTIPTMLEAQSPRRLPGHWTRTVRWLSLCLALVLVAHAVPFVGSACSSSHWSADKDGECGTSLCRPGVETPTWSAVIPALVAAPLAAIVACASASRSPHVNRAAGPAQISIPLRC